VVRSGGRTGWMYADWNKNSTGTGNAGYPVTEPEVYLQMVELFYNSHLHVGTHAVGDKGIDWAVEAYADALKKNPFTGLRHSIIHCNEPTDHAIAVMVDLQKRYDADYPEAQAEFMWWIGDTDAGNYGPQRSLRIFPFKTFVSKGIRWGGGTTRHSSRCALWAVGVGGAHASRRGLRDASVRNIRLDRNPHRVAFLHDLVGPPAFYAATYRIDRARQGRGLRGLGSRHVHDSGGRPSQFEMRDDHASWQNCLSLVNHSGQCRRDAGAARAMSAEND
jgi:hypothetical protein